MALDPQDFSKSISIDSDLANRWQAESKRFAARLEQEKTKVIEKAILQLLWKAECKIGDLLWLHYADGREYITAPGGVGFRIDMNRGDRTNDYRVTLAAIPVIMDKEAPKPDEDIK